MNRDQMEHAIRAVGDISGASEVIVVGSQAILGQFPDAPLFLRRSMELDVIPIGNAGALDSIAGAMGAMSRFEVTHGFHVDAVELEAIKLSVGWRDRLHVVRNAGTRNVTGSCLDVSDIAASKLAAYRIKDREYVRALLAHGLLSSRVLLLRVSSLPIPAEKIEAIENWIRAVEKELPTDSE